MYLSHPNQLSPHTVGASHQRYPFFLVTGGGFMGKKRNKNPPPKFKNPTATASNRAKVKNWFLKLGGA